MNSLRNYTRLIPILSVLVLLVTAVGVPRNAVALPLLTWGITGPGTTSAVVTPPDTTALNYSLNPAGFSTVTWTASAVAAVAGDYNFDWNYSGFHSFFRVTAFLNTFNPVATLVNAGPANCCTSPSNGFAFNGTVAFSGVAAGSTIGFTLGGSNFDSNNVLNGTLRLRQVPEPATLLLLGVGLLGVGVRRRFLRPA